MINWFQKRLAKGVVVVCLSEIGEKAIPLRFVKLTQKKDFSKLARADDIYVLEKRSITKYYYYSEPGNPFLSEKYHCLADFVLEILASKIRNRVLMAAMQLSYFPEKCEFPELKAYLEKNNFGERTIDKIQLGMEIEKYLSQPIYHKVDKIMNQTAFGFVNWLIFGRDSIKKQGHTLSLMGKWEGHDISRKYTNSGYSSVSISAKNDISENWQNYQVTRVFNQVILITIFPSDGGLKFEERLIISQDASTLIVYNHHGRKIFQRVSASSAT